jgi:hypothetical protein
LAVRFVSPVIPPALFPWKPGWPARTRQFSRPARLARLARLDANPGSDRARRDDRDAVHRPKSAAARVASIPLVVDRTFLCRA